MFNEKTKEYSRKQGKEVPVWRSPKYEQSREKALEIMKAHPDIKEGDFWILMNETKGGSMAYTGLIISHNACLKLNDSLPEKDRFEPSSITIDKSGFGGALVFIYENSAQGIYEVGEVSAKNCQNAYPYAMALKRCFDRVVLKLTKLAYNGVYSDSEAEEFREPDRSEPAKTKPKGPAKASGQDPVDLPALIARKGLTVGAICRRYGVRGLEELTDSDYFACITGLNAMEDK